jgi:hypothetical protein
MSDPTDSALVSPAIQDQIKTLNPRLQTQSTGRELCSLFSRYSHGLLSGALAIVWACTPAPPGPSALRLVDRFDEARIENSHPVTSVPSRIHWIFDEDAAPGSGSPASPTSSETMGWVGLQGIDGLSVREGHLAGRTSERAVLAVSIPEEPDSDDSLYAIEVRMRVSDGASLGISLMPGRELPRQAILFDVRRQNIPDSRSQFLRDGSWC